MTTEDKLEVEQMNQMAKQNFNQLNVMDQNQLIHWIYNSVRRYMYSVFKQIGREIENTLHQDSFDGMVQEVVFSLVDLLKKNQFEPHKSKFSTLLGSYTKNRIYKAGYLEGMKKRKGFLVPLFKENEDGTFSEFLYSDDNVEEEVFDKIDKEEKIVKLRHLISQLKEREKKIIYLRMQDKTFEEIAKEIGLSKNRIRQIVVGIYEFVREEFEKDAS